MKKQQNQAETEIDLPDKDIIAHLQIRGIKTEDGMPLDFIDHMFMWDIYIDMADLKRDIVGLKAAQVTFTTTATNAVLYIAKQRHVDIIYTLPTFDDVRQFVGGKVNRIVAQNPIYQSWVDEKDTIEQKAVGENIIYFRGTHTTKSATMVSSDLNVYDEVDSSNQEVIEQYSTRLQHSELKRQWWFSHPSVPGNGVDKYWVQSDQKHWFIKCPECKQRQFMSWPESIDPVRKCYQCKFCKGEITNDSRRRGKWIPRFKDRELSGYWIPLLICPWVSAEEVLKYHKEKSPEYFYNKVLGLPYVGGGNKVIQSQIYQNLTPDMNKQEGRIVMGVDSGTVLRFVIGNKEGLFFFGECKQWEIDPKNPDEPSIEGYMKRWKRMIVIVDQGGDIIGPRKLRDKYPGRVFLCFYQSDKKNVQLIRWGENDESGKVMADRNRMIQLVVDEFTDRRIPLQYIESPDDWYDYWLHFNHIYRIAQENKALHTMEYRWERSGRDDWVHATVYWRIGISRFGSTGFVEKDPRLNPEPNSYMVTPDEHSDTNPLRKVVQKAYVVPEDEDWRNSG